MPQDRDLIAVAQKVAACPHIGTCRAEMASAGKEMPLPGPSPDYIGRRYRGLVIIGGNPGLAHTGAHHANDAHMFELQQRLAGGDEEAFHDLMAFLPTSMAHWKQMVSLEARSRLDYDIEEVAYVDIVKCATRPLGSDLSSLLDGTRVLRRCWVTHTKTLLELLKPSHIVALWQPIIPVLQRLGFRMASEVRRGSHSGARHLRLEERYQHVKPVFDHYYGR